MSSLERLIVPSLFTTIPDLPPFAALHLSLLLSRRMHCIYSHLQVPNPHINISPGKPLFYQGLAISYIRVMKKQRHYGEKTLVSTLPEIMGLGGEKKTLIAVNNCSLLAIVQNKLRRRKESTAAHS